MKPPFYNMLHDLDRYWLLNKPFLWITQIHWMIYFFIPGLSFVFMASLLLPVRIWNATSLGSYFSATLMLTVLVLTPWFYLQLRWAPHLRRISQARPALAILACYFFICALYLTWPFLVANVLRERVSYQINEKEIENDYRLLSQLDPRREKTREGAIKVSFEIEKFAQKYKTGDYLGKYFVYDAASVYQDRTLYLLCQLGHIKGSSVARATQCSEEWSLQKLPDAVRLSMFALFAVLLLRVRQSSSQEGFLGVALLAIPFYISALTSYALPLPIPFFVMFGIHLDAAVCGTLLLFFLSGACAFIYAPYLKRRSIFFETAFNAFVLLLLLAPALVFVFLLSVLVPGEDHSASSLSWLAGAALSFVMSPEIQRRYITVQAHPY